MKPSSVKLKKILKQVFLLVCSFVVVVVAVVVAVEVTERYDCIFLDFVTLINFFFKAQDISATKRPFWYKNTTATLKTTVLWPHLFFGD